MKRQKRKIKLINPGLQLRSVGAFAGVALLSFILQGLFVASRLNEQRLIDANGGGPSTGIWIEVLLLSIGLFLPLTVAVGIVMTHRIAGPAYRMEQHLRSILRGDEPGQCKLRKSDEFQELCELLNRTVKYLEQGADELSEDEADQRRKRFRAVS